MSAKAGLESAARPCAAWTSSAGLGHGTQQEPQSWKTQYAQIVT
jgi:hypothetical protein